MEAKKKENERATWGPPTEEELKQAYELAAVIAAAIPDDCDSYVVAHAAGIVVGNAVQAITKEHKEHREAILRDLSKYVESCTRFFDKMEEKYGAV